ncbi:hypothetical protein ABIA06_005321 [Bradyrhizobium yuanmingense]|uniref:hypothetical protein n=1 Tax=Bradyrhizobium yuanmingense TaxID=108015 RepID=UPI0035151AC0
MILLTSAAQKALNQGLLAPNTKNPGMKAGAPVMPRRTSGRDNQATVSMGFSEKM